MHSWILKFVQVLKNEMFMMIIDEYQWQGIYTLGIDKIDNDHKKLLHIYNHLVNIINEKGDRKEFASVLTDMFEYSQSHFEKEELYMLKLNYPFLEQHKGTHRTYLIKVSLFNADLLSNNPPKPEKVLDFLIEWWSKHIPNCDKKYVEYKKTISTDANY